MASLYFYYAAMDAGKSSYLLQAAHNYRTAGKRVILMKPQCDTRIQPNYIVSRIGLSHQALLIQPKDHLFKIIQKEIVEDSLACVMVDEAQFLTVEQVWHLSDIVDQLNIPVLCFGIRTDAFGDLFSGSQTLLGIADKLHEIKSICKKCHRKASMQLRLNEAGQPIQTGTQVFVGANDQYLAVCRKHYKYLMKSSTNKPCSVESIALGSEMPVNV
ncbi:MAG: thymidine kinase [Endozoicomonadaceae bacterium]|nr:thymidine kinase [Endozoicomonadaceae bacterium]